ncbi:MAG: RNA polymerase sigma factor [Marinilabiliales bacterium]
MEDISAILKACRAGKQSAQKKLFELFEKKMFAVCLRYTKDYSEAEDIAQEGFVRVFSNIKQYKGTGSLENWIKKIMINTALEKFRKKKEFIISIEDHNTGEFVSEIDSIYTVIDGQELMNLVHKLPPQYKIVFNLYAIDGYKHEEISKMLGISIGTSKSNLSRARQILKKGVEELYKENYLNKMKNSC